jgi:hypothetical protein
MTNGIGLAALMLAFLNAAATFKDCRRHGVDRASALVGAVVWLIVPVMPLWADRSGRLDDFELSGSVMIVILLSVTLLASGGRPWLLMDQMRNREPADPRLADVSFAITWFAISIFLSVFLCLWIGGHLL